MAHILVNRTDSSCRATEVILPECPFREYTRRARKTIDRRVAGQRITTAFRLDPERGARQATLEIEIVVCVRLRAINDGRGAIWVRLCAASSFQLRRRLFILPPEIKSERSLLFPF